MFVIKRNLLIKTRRKRPTRSPGHAFISLRLSHRFIANSYGLSECFGNIPRSSQSPDICITPPNGGQVLQNYDGLRKSLRRNRTSADWFFRRTFQRTKNPPVPTRRKTANRLHFSGQFVSLPFSRREEEGETRGVFRDLPLFSIVIRILGSAFWAFSELSHPVLDIAVDIHMYTAFTDYKTNVQEGMYCENF